MLYSDAHLHVNPIRGLGAYRIAKKFKNENGWFISIVSLPPHYYDYAEPNIDSYRKTLEIINREAHQAREVGLTVTRFMGLHPAEVDYYYRKGIKSTKLLTLVEDVFKLFEKALKEGLIDGIGEVGRPHYSTSPERHVFSEVILIKALLLARDYKVPIQLHLEQGEFITAYSIKQLAEIIGIEISRILMHHVDYDTAKWSNEYSIPFTIPIKYFNNEYARNPWRKCMLESDYIDDPSRPGVSAYPWDIPRIVEEHIRNGVLSEDQAYTMLVDNVVKYFHVKPP